MYSGIDSDEGKRATSFGKGGEASQEGMNRLKKKAMPRTGDGTSSNSETLLRRE